MAEKKEVTEKHWVINVLYGDGKIQLEKRTEPNTSLFGYIIVPGGSIEGGETEEEAAEREAKEEYGVEAISVRKIGVVHNIGPNSGTSYFRHVFLITNWRGELSNPENRNEHIEASLEEARVLCEHTISQQILDLVENELNSKNG